MHVHLRADHDRECIRDNHLTDCLPPQFPEKGLELPGAHSMREHYTPCQTWSHFLILSHNTPFRHDSRHPPLDQRHNWMFFHMTHHLMKEASYPTCLMDPSFQISSVWIDNNNNCLPHYSITSNYGYKRYGTIRKERLFCDYNNRAVGKALPLHNLSGNDCRHNKPAVYSTMDYPAPIE